MIRKKILVMITLLLFSSISWASQSCNVKSNKDSWDIKFKITNAEMSETVTAKKKNGASETIVFWTDAQSEKADAIFADNKVLKNEDYEVWIFYDPENAEAHKAGLATYYIKSGTDWEFVESEEADFTSLNGANISLSSSSPRITSLSCHENTEHPNIINRSPKFEFGTIDCSSGTECTIKFDKKFNTVPLVFVMPVIDANLTSRDDGERITEYPSTVGVKDVTRSEATIYQDFAPAEKADDDVDFIDKDKTPVGKIDYFAIEQGVLELENGSKIVSGTLPIGAGDDYIGDGVASHYSCKKNGCNETEQNDGIEINFSNFGLSEDFTEKPGVLVQTQTINNKNAGISEHWATALARDVTLRSAVIALDKSEVYKTLRNKKLDASFNPVSEPEVVAFVAGQGEGFKDGLKFWLGYGVTEYTLKKDDPVISPVLDGCKVYTDFPEGVVFDEPPVLVANKNSRKGSNGGWLRRCDVRTSSVALINEEDMQRDKERGHTDEQVGWFMFEKANPNPICSVFTSPLQTWAEYDDQDNIIDGNGTLSIQNATVQIIGTKKNSSGERLVGFEQNNISVANPQTMKVCDGQACVGDAGMIQPKEALGAFLGGTESLSLSGYTGDTQSKELSGNALYKSVNIQEGGSLILKNGTYWFESISMNGKSAIVVPEGEEVVIHTKKLYMTNTSFIGTVSDDVMQSNTSKKPDIYRSSSIDVVKNGGWFADDSYLRINVHKDSSLNGSAPLYMDSNAIFIGMAYNESNTYLTSNVQFYGALTTKDIYLDSNSKIIRSSGCLAPVNSYELAITPSTQLALMCGEDTPTFDILTQNNSVGESLEVIISIPDADSVAFTLEASVGSGNACSITSSADRCKFISNRNGELTISAKVDNFDANLAKTRYQLKAMLLEDTDKSKSVDFSFVPYKFDIKSSNQDKWDNSAIPMIANKPVDIDVRVLACPPSSDSSSPVVLKYNHSLKGDDVSSLITMPSANQSGAISLSGLDFKGGLAKSSVTFTDSGEATITLKDSEFDCDSFDELKDPDTKECQIDGGILSGEFSVKSRPWKFSVCPQSTEGEYVSANGNSKSGNAFVAAGQLFSVRVAPLKYNSPECSEQEQLTHNYFLSEASAELSYTLDSPAGGILGNLSGTLVRNVSDDKKIAYSYVFSDLAYSEVGSINLSALETGAFYSSIEVDGDKGVKGSRKIGRFYPDSFVINSTKWDAPKNQGNISYMGQNFDLAEVSILPYGMGSSAPLKNYHLIDGGYQAKLAVLGDGKVSNSLILDTSLGDWRENPDVSETSQWYLQDAFAYVTKPLDENGPFNTNDRLSKATEFSLEISGTDPVRFKNSSSESYSISAVLPSQPPVRFGRMMLSDVGGYQGQKLTVPLSVEFWNGERFVTNAEDNNTSVINFIQKQTPIWPDDGTDCSVLLEGNATVSGGKTRKIKAQQDLATCQSSVRQQTEVWLGLDSNGSNVPWLKYNWDKDSAGEENPSSVVTFGIHRGNDRVIYRGEPGLTGQ